MIEGFGDHEGLSIPRKRRSIRFRGFDYSQAGAYYVTICTQNRATIFGKIVASQMLLNEVGKMVQRVWREVPVVYPNILLDTFIIMPEHFHAIVILEEDDGFKCKNIGCNIDENQIRTSGNIPPKSLSDVIHHFKSLTTSLYYKNVRNQIWPSLPGKLWQRNYFEHIIRSDSSLEYLRRYIRENPSPCVDDP